MPKKFDIVLDAEASDLLPMVDTIHVAVVKLVGLPEGEAASYRTIRTKEDLLRIINSGRLGRVVNHGLLSYDLPLFRKVYGIPFNVSACGTKDTWNGVPVVFVDTLHLSQFLNPDRVDGHSLESWGLRVGLEKGKHTDWSVYSQEMEDYCRRDVEVTDRTYHTLLKELEKRSE